MALILPLQAEVIAKARENGQRPDSVVFVAIDSMLGVTRAYPKNFAVLCGSRIAIRHFDFAWVVGLDIEILAERIEGNERAVQAIKRINSWRPRNLVGWETQSGRRWWIRDELSDWPRPYQLFDSDRRLMREATA